MDTLWGCVLSQAEFEDGLSRADPKDGQTLVLMVIPWRASQVDLVWTSLTKFSGSLRGT